MPSFLQVEQRAACGGPCHVVQVPEAASVRFSLPPFFQETEEGHSTAWNLVVELHLWEALHNFPQAGFQSDHVLIQI